GGRRSARASSCRRARGGLEACRGGAPSLWAARKSYAMTRGFEPGDADRGREPCPDRIVEDLGGAFGMGAVGGFVWHFVKGARHSPAGDRLQGAMYSARNRAPILGGNFAVWGGTFSCFDCSLQYIRRRDDHWNAIASGFLTGGVLAARGGWKAGGAMGHRWSAAWHHRGRGGPAHEVHVEDPAGDGAGADGAGEADGGEYNKRKDAGELSPAQSWLQYAQASGMAPSLGSKVE
ncbi:unnamed protein product, partial [Prorocentrum cordatum]